MVAIIIHGGAWDIPQAEHEAHLRGVKQAAEAGYEVLQRGCSAIDAVEEAVRLMEMSTTFDAGAGSVLNAEGEIEMDAAIMDGSTLGLGAVAAIKNVTHPISVARHVMEGSSHCLLCGDGALRFAESVGAEMRGMPPTAREMDRLQRIRGIKNYQQRSAFTEGPKGTVGAVAMDDKGHIAAATSTGGTPGKIAGRVGDSPLVGCGTYADDESAGVSVTGFGESIMKVTLARRVCEGVERGMTAEAAARNALDHLARRVDGLAGVIVIDSNGEMTHVFNTPYMAFASIDHEGAYIASIGKD
jgi:beta-aspartyl-peptidase (threonine type)